MLLSDCWCPSVSIDNNCIIMIPVLRVTTLVDLMLTASTDSSLK